MRVLMLSRTLPPHGAGGLGAAALDLAAALGNAGAKVRLLTTAGGKPAGRLRGVRVHALGAPPGRYSAAWWRASLAAYDRWADEVDVVLGVSAAANAVAAHRRERPAVFQAHGVSLGEIASKLRSGRLRALAGIPRQLWWGVARDRAYRDYAAVVAVGERVRRQLHAWPTSRLVGATPVHLIRNGIEPAAFRFDPKARRRLRTELGVAPEATLVLFAGRLQADKGPCQAIEAVKLARATGAEVRLILAGEGPEQVSLERALAATLELGGAARLIGARPRSEMAAWYSAADALLFPTRRSEGLPLVVLEALAAGLTVLTTRAGAEDADLPCLRLGAHDTAAFAAALKAVAEDRDQRASRLPSAFHLKHAAESYLDLFEDLAAAPRRLAA